MQRLVALGVAALGLAALLAPFALPVAHARRLAPETGPAQNRSAPRSACSALISAAVRPDQLQLCDTAEVSVTIGLTCPTSLPIHMMIAVDRSRSIGQNDQFMGTIRRSADQVLDELDSDHPGTLAGVLSHGFEVTVEANLSNSQGQAQGGVNRVKYNDSDYGEDPPEAVDVAKRLLEDKRGTDSPIEIIVLYGDGCDATVPGCPAAARRAASVAKGAGMTVATVCFTESARANCEDYKAMASNASLYFEAPASRLPKAIRDLRTEGEQLELASVDVTAVLEAALKYVAGSARPVATVTGQTLTWPNWRRQKPGTAINLVYQVQSDTVGPHTVHALGSQVGLLDSLERVNGPLPLPTGLFTITGPCGVPTDPPSPTPPPTDVPTPTKPPSPTPPPADTPTPRASDTPRATATTAPSATPVVVWREVYLPLLVRRACRPEEAQSDVVVVLDTSASMLETSGGSTKLAAAQAAARDFVGLLDLGPDRASIVAFNSAARTAQHMTDNRSLLVAAIDQLSTAQGTRIDLALEQARLELAEFRQFDRHGVVVLLTDGRQDGADSAAVLAQADLVKRTGASIFTIGLGADVDGALLSQVATSPDMYVASPSGTDLAAIYAEIAYDLPCPGGAMWSR